MNKDKFILVRIIGGLGNQMYQYALAKKLSILNNNAPILLDTTLFEKYYRKYELTKLNINAEIADKDIIFKMDTGSLPLHIGKLIDKIPWIRVKDFIRKPFSKVNTEVGLNFHPEILETRESIYLKGYWNSYKYFSDIRNELLKDFSFKDEMNAANKSMAGLINSSEKSVSLHIRRGDYLKDTCWYPIYEEGYYERAMKLMEEKLGNPEYFVFSDDLDWVRKNIKFNHKYTIVDINKGDDSYWDMHLMSLCKNNIIANSTFSWWGGWLNKNEDKIVIAPGHWNKQKDFNIDDVIVPGWIKL